MNSDYYRSQIDGHQKKIADLQKKKADELKRASDYRGRAGQAMSSAFLGPTFNSLNRRAVTINQDMKAIMPGEGHSPEFLFRNLQSLGPCHISKMSTAAHATKRLEMDVLTSTEMLRPPKHLQNEFAEFSSKIPATRFRNSRSLRIAGDFCEATLQQAFTGWF